MKLNRCATAVLVLCPTAVADIWSPLDFFLALENPKQGDTQQASDAWTFRRASVNGTLMTGIVGALTCEQGFGLWGNQNGPYGFLPCVGPVVSPDEDLDGASMGRQPEFDGLMVIPTNDEDAFLVFTAGEPLSVPPLTLRAEMLYGLSNGVRISVKTRIGGQTTTWLDRALVPDDDGYQSWSLFEQDHPLLNKGDKLWIQVDPNGDYSADWANISLAGVGCYADCTSDGSLDLFDFLCFVNSFNAGDTAADCDSLGGLDLFDFLCFVNAFNAGC